MIAKEKEGEFWVMEMYNINRGWVDQKMKLQHANNYNVKIKYGIPYMYMYMYLVYVHVKFAFKHSKNMKIWKWLPSPHRKLKRNTVILMQVQ